MNKNRKTKKWKNVYYCRACGWKSFRYSVIRDHIMLYHPEVYPDYKNYIVFYRRVAYNQYLNRKEIAKMVLAIKGKVKMPLRMYL